MTYRDELAAIRQAQPLQYLALQALVGALGACWDRKTYRRIRDRHRPLLSELQDKAPEVRAALDRSFASARRRSGR